ncbi:hypothetical protein D3C81_2119910 [compost metagenome]
MQMLQHLIKPGIHISEFILAGMGDVDAGLSLLRFAEAADQHSHRPVNGPVGP